MSRATKILLSIFLLAPVALGGCKRKFNDAETESRIGLSKHKIETDLQAHMLKKRSYFPLDWDAAAKNPPYSYLNLAPSEFVDPGALIGLEYVVAGTQFNYRIPMSVVKLGQTLNYRAGDPADSGLYPSPFKLHRENGLPLTVGYFDETLQIGGDQGEKVSGKFVNSNCFSCHSGRVGNTIVAGAFNKDADFTNDGLSNLGYLNQITRRAVGMTDGEYQISRRILSMWNSMLKPILAGSKGIGDNQGAYITIAYASFLKPNATGPEDTEPMTYNEDMRKHFCETCEAPPVQAMPWWTGKYKGRHYWFGASSTDDQQRMKDFVGNFAIPNHGYSIPDSSWEHRIERQYWIFRYIKAVRSPVHPDVAQGRVNKQLATLGRKIFHGEQPTSAGKTMGCTGCHGDYTPSGRGYVVNYEDSKQAVGTDPAYNEKLVQLGPLSAKIDKITQADRPGYASPVDQTPAYSPPPLDGVWASAPYFHNGSVPTVMQVLMPDSRPRVWGRVGGSGGYDYARLGLPHSQHVDHIGPKAVQKLIYNTTARGYSNGGHTAQVRGLQEQDALAILEFFKCLGGPEMKSARDPQENVVRPVDGAHPCEGQ